MTPEEQAAALAEFPELRRLRDLRNAGWVFITITNDDEITEVRGVYTWPEGWADAVRPTGLQPSSQNPRHLLLRPLLGGRST